MRERDTTLDAWRGLAVVLMVVDHFCICFPDRSGSLLRVTVDRGALPLFAACTGVSWVRYGVSIARVSQLVCVLPVTLLWCRAAGLPCPDVMCPYAIAALLSPLIVRWPFLLGSLGVVQSVAWQLPHRNYQVGTVVVLVSLGVASARASEVPYAGCALPAFPCRWLASVGRRPLTLYVGHLMFLGLVKQLSIEFGVRSGVLCALALASIGWCAFVASLSSAFVGEPGRSAVGPVAPRGAGPAAEGGLTPSH